MKNNALPVHPRKLMAKAGSGTNKLKRINWRRAAADQAKDPVKKGEKK